MPSREKQPHGEPQQPVTDGTAPCHGSVQPLAAALLGASAERAYGITEISLCAGLCPVQSAWATGDSSPVPPCLVPTILNPFWVTLGFSFMLLLYSKEELPPLPLGSCRNEIQLWT